MSIWQYNFAILQMNMYIVIVTMYCWDFKDFTLSKHFSALVATRMIRIWLVSDMLLEDTNTTVTDV